MSFSEVEYFALPLITQIKLAWMMAFRGGFEMSVSYSLVAGMTVALGIFNPQSWPPMFGSYAQGYTLRNIWGKCWRKDSVLSHILSPFELVIGRMAFTVEGFALLAGPCQP